MAELHGGTAALRCKLCTKRLRLRENEGQEGRGARIQRSWGQEEAVKSLP